MSNAAKLKPEKKQRQLTNLAELQKLCMEKKRVEFEFSGQQCALEVRRLTPAEQARVADILESVTPPVVRGPTPEQDRINYNDAGYIKAKQDAITRARSWALYIAVPCFAESKPGLTDLAEIANYIQGQLTEPILDTLWNAIQQSGRVELAELVNFT